MKPLVIYHDNCADGFGAAFAAWMKLGDEAEYAPCQYGQVNTDTDFIDKFGWLDGRDCYVLDFSFPREVMDQIFRRAKRVVWCDHHKSAFEMWCGKYERGDIHCENSFGEIILDDNKSGAMLAWEYFHPTQQSTNRQESRPYAIHFNGYGNNPECTPGFMEDGQLYDLEHVEQEVDRMNRSALAMGDIPLAGQSYIYEARPAPKGYGEDFSEIPMFFKHIDDYDRWVFDIPKTKAFNKALWSYAPWKFENWKAMFIADGSTPYDKLFVEGVMYPRLYDEGSAILRAHDQNVQAVMRGSARKCEISTCCPQHGPDIADTLPASWSDGYLRRFDGVSANCPPHLTSDVGHELAVQSGTFGLLWYIDKDGQCRCGLRSNGDYDVSIIAKAFGGGGHKNAAGFTTDIQTLLGWIK